MESGREEDCRKTINHITEQFKTTPDGMRLQNLINENKAVGRESRKGSLFMNPHLLIKRKHSFGGQTKQSSIRPQLEKDPWGRKALLKKIYIPSFCLINTSKNRKNLYQIINQK